MLTLKREFIETICQVYIEKHNPKRYQKLLQSHGSHKPGPICKSATTEQLPEEFVEHAGPNNSASDNTNLPPSLFVDEALNGCTFYELLNTQEGFLTLQSYFIKSAILLDRDTTFNTRYEPATNINANQASLLNRAGTKTLIQDDIGLYSAVDPSHALGGLTDQSRAAAAFLNHYPGQVLTPLGMGNSSGGRFAPIPFGPTSTQNLMLLSTGGGAHNNPLQSNFIIEVDEFKFSKIINSVIKYESPKVSQEKKAKSFNIDDSCSMSDEDYDEETELSAATNPEDDIDIDFKGAKQPNKVEDQSTELTWPDIQTLFQLLDGCNFESVGFREFCAEVLLLAALRDNMLLQCLYQHGVLLFDIIGAGQNVMTGERAKVLGRTLMGLSDSLIDQCCENIFDLKQASLVTFEDFQLLYFEIFKTLQLSGGREIDFEHFESRLNDQGEQLLTDRNK